MCCITDMAESLREATAMLNRKSEDMSPQELKTSLTLIEALSTVLRDEVDDMDHINRLHEFYLAKSEHLEGLNHEVE